jgi:hypothetical protein
MSIIETFNKAVSDAVNKEGDMYIALIGAEDFTPEATIDESDDYNCGALCNELEYLRATSNYYVRSFDIDIAEDDNLDSLLNAFLDLPRRNDGEPDDVYRNRFRFIAIEKTNPRRTTRWAILDAISYFLPDATKVQIVEPFDSQNLYFQMRIEGAVDYDSAIIINNVEQGYINQNFVGGEGIGETISYLGELIDRIRAAGVDFDLLFINQYSTTKSIDAIIGRIQIYKTIGATIRAPYSTTKSIDAIIV